MQQQKESEFFATWASQEDSVGPHRRTAVLLTPRFSSTCNRQNCAPRFASATVAVWHRTRLCDAYVRRSQANRHSGQVCA